jgi:pyruvyltransferase
MNVSKFFQLLGNIYSEEKEIFKLSSKNIIRVKFYSEILNWGDMINVDIIGTISGKKVVNCSLNYTNHLLGIGSVLGAANSSSTVWGSGFLSPKHMFKSKPKKICSVRGPLSMKLLHDNNVCCPDIFGDPALLLPSLYTPNVNKAEKKYKLGIIPHYNHKNSDWFMEIGKSSKVKIIDIQQSGVECFVNDLHSCENIASSSLHGLIASDAYRIPNCRLNLHNMDSFKFDDYYLGVGVNHYNTYSAIGLNQHTVDNIISKCEEKNIVFDKDTLLEVFPHDLIFTS